jgi:hypothetical protein
LDALPAGANPSAKTATLLDDNEVFFQIGLMRASINVPKTIISDHVIEATTLTKVTLSPYRAETGLPYPLSPCLNPSASGR